MFDYLQAAVASMNPKSGPPVGRPTAGPEGRPEDDLDVKLAIWILVIATILYVVSTAA